MALVGGVVGWQGLLGVAAIDIGLLAPASLLPRVAPARQPGYPRPFAPLAVPVAVVVFLLAWRPLAAVASRFF